MIAWLAVSLVGAAFAQSETPRCDLDVLYIQRTPRYQGYQPNYGVPGKENLPLLTYPGSNKVMPDAEAKKIQRWPKDGEVVTYTAVVENKGEAAAPEFEWSFTLDGKVVSTGRISETLKQGQRANVKLSIPWKFQKRLVGFQVDPKGKLEQLSKANDKRTVWTHAKLLVCFVDRVTYNSFAKNKNLLGTYSFEDWCQAHVDNMNDKFQHSVYPRVAPKGILDRVSVDFIGILPDDKAWEKMWSDGSALAKGWDGAWWFGRAPDCSKWAAGFDWGLIHEWGHQLGLTDLYALDVAPESNQVLDEAKTPLLIGHMSAFVGTMMHGHGNVLFSEDQAIAMNHQVWRRRGYYGDYYYNLPKTCAVRILDLNGKPVEGAKLTFWQRAEHGPGLEGMPTFEGKTNKSGVYLMPNIEAPKLSTLGDFGGGYVLSSNPFGHINVVGGNGVFLVKCEARKQVDYAWLEIPQFNIAKEDPLKSGTVTFKLPVPQIDAGEAPASPTVTIKEGKVTLEGPPSGYLVYRADPTQYEWKKVGQTTTKSYSESSPGSGLYRYSLVVMNGNKPSPRSKDTGVAFMSEPWGLAVDRDGSVFVRDRRNGQTLWLRPNGSAVGFVGSVHWHFEGSFDHALDSSGNLYVAQWPHGYDATHTLIRKVDPRGKGQEYGRTDLSYNLWESQEPGHLNSPMGVTVADDGRIVVADTGNNRVQILASDGKVLSIVGGLQQPQKAMIVNDRLVVADMGNARVAIYTHSGADWILSKSIPCGEPVYLCAGPAGRLWVADKKAGRVFAIDTDTWTQVEKWCYPQASESPSFSIRGIGYVKSTNELVFVDAVERNVVRVKL